MTAPTSEQRRLLTQRLLALIGTRVVLTDEPLSEQIETLLAEVLQETPDVVPQPLLLDEDDPDQRVVITGIGVVSPFGVGLQPFWEGLRTGQSGIVPITLCDVSESPCKIAGEVPHFDPLVYLPPKIVRRTTRGTQFALVAAQLALTDARLTLPLADAEQTGVLIACGGTSYPETQQAIQTLLERGAARVSPLYIPMALPNMAAAQVAIQFGLHGYTSTISTACAAGAQAIGEAAAVIRRGDAEVMLAGGAEAPISEIGLASFNALHALSRWSDDPARASRPFDLQRDGFVPGEGAAMLVLERLSAARAREAPIYAEVIGYGVSSDAHHVTAPDPDGYGAALAMRRALHHAHVSPQQVDYIKAHATGTPQGDIAETLAIKQVFGEYATSVPISAPKSMIGHLTGAAGAVEAAAAVLALRHNLIPPTINLDQPDPACDLDYVPHTAREAALQTVIANSFGFGGVNAVLVFRRVTQAQRG
jgi:3-oxoacyl-[acyl-carrier-protein] synthase II